MAGNVPIYIDQGGANMWVGPGGTLTILEGGTFSDEGGTFTPPTNLALTNASVSGTLTALAGSTVDFVTGGAVSLGSTLTVTSGAGVVCNTGAALTMNAGSTLALYGDVDNAAQTFNSGPITSTGTAAYVIAVSPALQRVPLAGDLSMFAISTTGVTNGSYSITFTTSHTTSISVEATTGLVYQVVANLVNSL
jgi:hypothetical protein